MNNDEAVVAMGALLCDAAVELDKLKVRCYNQRRELRRLNKLVHEHTSRAQSAGTKSQQRAVQLAAAERRIEQLTEMVEALQEYHSVQAFRPVG